MSSLFKRRTKGEVVFTFVCYLLITLLAISTLLPFLHVISKAVSSEGAVITGSILFWPIDFQTGTLHYVLDTPERFESVRDRHHIRHDPGNAAYRYRGLSFIEAANGRP